MLRSLQNNVVTGNKAVASVVNSAAFAVVSLLVSFTFYFYRTFISTIIRLRCLLPQNQCNSFLIFIPCSFWFIGFGIWTIENEFRWGCTRTDVHPTQRPTNRCDILETRVRIRTRICFRIETFSVSGTHYRVDRAMRGTGRGQPWERGRGFALSSKFVDFCRIRRERSNKRSHSQKRRKSGTYFIRNLSTVTSSIFALLKWFWSLGYPFLWWNVNLYTNSLSFALRGSFIQCKSPRAAVCPVTVAFTIFSSITSMASSTYSASVIR